jgi:hypothetical protein
MKLFRKRHLSIEIYDCPGTRLNSYELKKLQKDLIEIGKQSLDAVPNYQCFSKDLNEFNRLIISVARNDDGKAIAFCSSYILEAGDYGKILHLGLTCIGPEARGLGLTHKLTSKVIYRYFTAHAKLGSFWISNVACVLSSLGNVALHFEDVYPSPYVSSPLTEHKGLARIINDNYRHELYINASSKFDHDEFIFRGSVKGTIFQKDENDLKFHHRNEELNHFFKKTINFNNGDEVLQIGKVSLMSYPKYLLRNRKKRKHTSRDQKQNLNAA